MRFGSRSAVPSSKPKQVILVLGVERSGTNRLLDIMRNLAEVEVRGEIFNPVSAGTIRENDMIALGNLAGIKFGSPSDQHLIDFLRGNVLFSIRWLLDRMPLNKSLMSVKIFKSHVSHEIINEVLSAGIVSSVIFVNRRAIDCFVSLEKADVSGQWWGADTTHIRPILSLKKFAGYYLENQNWLSPLPRLVRANGLPLTSLSYEKDIDCEDSEFLSNLRTALGMPNLSNSLSATSTITRQDQSASLSDKVENWEEFKRDLKSNGLYDLAMQPFPLELNEDRRITLAQIAY
ncbi:MAG: hypothetical protein AAGF25_05840 [Pseudomonadota bacterium]